VACSLTDVMTYVPYEQQTFEFGPRDYLNQMMTLISSLRGGQQKYMPLLLTKINDTMPSMPTPGYSITSAPGSSRLDELYESSQENSSGHNSSVTSPFGSPSLNTPTTYGFPDFSNIPACTSAGFQSINSTAGMQYADLNAESNMHMYREDAAMHGYPGSAGPSKYETG
jgi:hypothetical protein